MRSLQQKKDLEFYLNGLINGKFTLKQAAQSCHLSVQWLCHLKKNYRLYGSQALVHGNTGKIPYNKISDSTGNNILKIYAQPQFKNINFLYFLEVLEQDYCIKVSYSWLAKFFKLNKIRSPEAHKIKHKDKVHRLRLRRQNEGDLLQIDGTPYEWFKLLGDNSKYCMHGAIDDATSSITALYIAQNECLYGITELISMTAKTHGLPRELYMDRAAWACVTPRLKNCVSITEQLAGIHQKRTQVQRMLSELNINQILAWSPQAKGRVERMWHTIQDRFPLWAYRNNIKTVVQANQRMQEFIDYYNKHWAVQPKNNFQYYRPAPANLAQILCAQYPRKTNINGCFKFHSYNFAVTNCPFVANKSFTLCVSVKGLSALMPDNKYYPVQLLDDDIGYVIGDSMPQVVKNIIYDNYFTPAKEVSA